jgi:general stress protein 26
MKEPVTELDQRFSDQGAVATGCEETRAALSVAELFWITTVRADGRPHLTPLVAVWHKDSLYFCTGAAEQKAVNLRGNPHVILMTGCHDWESGLDVVVEGDAVQVTEDIVLEQLAQAWTAKWDGRWQFQARDNAFRNPGSGAALVFSVTPGKVLTFTKGSFSQTRHTFAE